MKRLFLLMFSIVLIGCSGSESGTPTIELAPELEPQPTVVSTVAPTTVAPATDVPTPGAPTPEGYPLPNSTATPDGYPIDQVEPETDSAYPIPTSESTVINSVAAGLHYMDESGLWRVTADGLMTQIVPLVDAGRPQLSFDSSKIAYMLGGEPAIIIFDILTGEITSLSADANDMICCVFDWIGDSILVGVQGEEEFGPNIGRLVSITPDNTITPISSSLIGGRPSFHPTGLRVAYPENGQMQIYDYGAATTTLAASTITDATGAPLTIENLSYSTASWSPMLQNIAWAVSFVQDGEFRLGLAIFNIEDSSVQIFHPYTAIGTEYIPPAAAWHPTRSLIAFETIDQDESQRGIWLIDYATGEEQFILAGRNPLFSPDGTHLAFEHDAGIQIYSLADGSFTLLPSGLIVDWR